MEISDSVLLDFLESISAKGSHKKWKLQITPWAVYLDCGNSEGFETPREAIKEALLKQQSK